MSIIIDDFRGPHFFLSNFYPYRFEWRGTEWKSSEHAFQAAKTSNVADFERIRTAVRARDAKTLGRSIEKRPDWEAIRIDVMREIIAAKFAAGTLIEYWLTDTGDAELIEGNNWHDDFWGVCHCDEHAGVGLNWLGIILMEQRSALRMTK